MMPKHETKTCPRCGGSFECKAGDIAHCQCTQIILPETATHHIQQTYTDCLCLQCLQQLAHPHTLFREKYRGQR